MANMNQHDEKPDLLATMEQWGLEINVRSGQKRASVQCPFHGDTGRPNMSVWVDSQTFYCFRCTRGGDVYDFIGRTIYGDRWNSRDKEMFLEVINRDKTTTIPKRKAVQVKVEKMLEREVIQVLGLATKIYHMSLMNSPGEHARAVLIKRGIGLAAMRRYNLGYATEGALTGVLATYPAGLREAAEAAGLFYDGREWLKGRIIFPDLGGDGTVTNMAGRALQKDAYIRYLSLPGLPKTIWGLRSASSTMPTIVLESLPDAVNLRQMGFQGLAINGTGIAWYLIPKLEKLPIIALLPQNDRAGIEALEQWKINLPKSRTLVIPYNDDEKDINDMFQKRGEQETKRIITRALDEAGITIS